MRYLMMSIYGQKNCKIVGVRCTLRNHEIIIDLFSSSAEVIQPIRVVNLEKNSSNSVFDHFKIDK